MGSPTEVREERSFPGAKAPEERRALILRATIEIILERGFAGTRVQDIAQAAGTSTGLVLYHFGSLAGAMAAALQMAEDELHTHLTADLARLRSAPDKLVCLLRHSAGDVRADAEWRLWLEAWVRALHDDSIRAVRAEHEGRWRATLRSIIEEGSAAGVFTVADLDMTIDHLSALIDGLAVALSNHDRGMTTERFIDVCLAAARSLLHADLSARSTTDA